MLFEWDGEKAEANLKKHGISFDDAMLVFADERRKEFYDAAHSLYEDRYHTIGMVDRLLFVVYTERGEFSARLANRHEKRIYYDY